MASKKASEKENRWADNRLGVAGFACAVGGLIIFPLVLGAAAICLGYLNLKKETVNLWKLALHVGVLNVLFGLLLLAGAI